MNWRKHRPARIASVFNFVCWAIGAAVLVGVWVRALQDLAYWALTP